jgi:anaerobic magnesium-protoporphyrin IX monomethyl ester cyclase
MPDLLLTHGYFLYDDPKELKVMKPYVPLGILYICSHLRSKGFDVEVFDTTFSSLQDLTQHLQTGTPSVLGVYANLMTRKKVVEIVRIAHEAGWKTIVGGPEPGAYVREYLGSGCSRSRRGRDHYGGASSRSSRGLRLITLSGKRNRFPG